MEPLRRRMHVLCWTPSPGSPGHWLQKSGKPIGLHTLLTPSGQLVMVSESKEKHACPSQLQCYKPTLQVSA